MAPLLKLLIVVAIFGTALQQGWLTFATRLLAARLGGPAGLDPGYGLDGADAFRSLASGLVAGVRSLPDPWFSLVLMLAAALAAMLLVPACQVALRAAGRLAARLRGARA